jgi:hypothetical protein
MIFTLYPRVLVKIGEDERHVFDRSRLMFTEVAEIEKVTGLAYPAWLDGLGEYKITAIAALIHILRKRADMPSDFGSMQFNVADMDCVPLHDDGTEFTMDEMRMDLAKRVADAQKAADPGPTRAAASAVAPEDSPAMTGTSLSSPNGSGSAHGNGSTSRGRTSASAARSSTPS